MSEPIARLLLVVMATFSTVTTVHAQGLAVDVSAGRIVYEPVSSSVGTNNLIGTLRYDMPHEAWVYGAVAAPLGEGATRWGAAGAGGRMMAPGSSGRRGTYGADVAAHGFSFHDAVAGQVGTGGSLDAIPFVRLAANLAFIEARGGWRGHTLSFAGGRERRSVFETGARVGYGATFRVEGDARWVHAVEGTYPFVGTTVMYDGSPVQFWGHTGKWLHDDLGQATWAVGLAVPLAARSTIWASARYEASEPLYWNSSRRTWSVGMTQRLGRVAPPARAASRPIAGDAVVTLRVADAPSGDVCIAGDFNNWQPAPMQREGDLWILRLTLKPGVYHYAFRSAAGAWFVPTSTPGRREDGMGGHVGVLMVS
jgi:hypothetical protein